MTLGAAIAPGCANGSFSPLGMGTVAWCRMRSSSEFGGATHSGAHLITTRSEARQLPGRPFAAG